MPAAHHLAAPEAALPATVLPLPGLRRFQRLMAYEGWQVDLERLCTDRDYAGACLATAHTSSLDALRQAALQLFEAHQRNREPGLH